MPPDGKSTLLLRPPMRQSRPYAALEKKQRKSPETQRFQGFSGGRGRRARSCFATPLAVPEKIFGLPLFLDFFDRCAKVCSLHPPPAALAGVARHAPRASGSSLFRETKKIFSKIYSMVLNYRN